MSNQEIQNLANEIEADLKVAKTSDEIHAAIKKAAVYGKPLVYDYKQQQLWGGLALLVGLMLAYFGFAHEHQMRDLTGMGAGWIVVALVFVIGGFTPFIIAMSKSDQLSKIAKKAFYKDSLLDNNIVEKPCPDADVWKLENPEFRRGNYSRKFKFFYESTFKGEEFEFTYNYYRFHYVDQRTETYTTTGPNGNIQIRTRTVYDHYDRYGLVIPYSFAKNIQIYSSTPGKTFKESYTPASMKFDDMYNVKAADELLASKVTKPAVVVAFEDIANTLRGVNVEVTDNEKLILSFKDSDLIGGHQMYDLSEPEKFYEALIGHTDLKKLNQALSFVHTFMKHTDRNF